ncbi:hypothetical protein LEN26_010620 [Aphanomyces euteiches]|nr:hypothetical protein LEN26_010620 [Aphanomyces euteiches]
MNPTVSDINGAGNTQKAPQGNKCRIRPIDPDKTAGPRLSTLNNAELVPASKSVQASKEKATNQEDPYDNSMTTAEVAECMVGLLYLVFTLALSSYYLGYLSPFMADDLWWSGFNASGVQSYLMDVFNAQLNLARNQTVTIDFTSNMYGIEKDYSQFYTPIESSPMYPRLTFNVMSFNLATLVIALRQTAGPDWVTTQYCWIDFNRTWEVAHTVLRQKRCYARYTDNGAVYYEPFVRLVDWNKWLNGRFGNNFNITIGNPLSKMPEGQAWLTNTPYSFVDVESEVAFWRQAGITRYAVQFTNSYLYGMSETMGIQNALGVTQAFTTKRTISHYRSGGWTTIWMYFGMWNDIYFGSYFGYSYLLNHPDNQRFTPPCNYSDYVASPDNYTCDPCDPLWNPESYCYPNYEMYLNLPYTPMFQLVHSKIGPLNSIDMYFIPAPSSLVKLYTTFRSLVTQLILSNDSFATAISAVPALSSDPVPPSWSDPALLYMGGDPSCLFRQPSSSVQTSFAFDVSCTVEKSQFIVHTAYNTLFALWATIQTTNASVCNICPTANASCSLVFSQTTKAANIFGQTFPPSNGSFLPIIEAAYTETSKLELSIIQFAVNSSDFSNVFLNQTILGGQAASHWDFFGWMYVYDWVQGYREVVSFEGDANIIPLMSDKYDPIIDEAQKLEIPNNACRYLWGVTVVVTAVLVSVGFLVGIYTLLLRGRIVGRNLFQFNRVVGAVWVSRPLLFVRSLTAIILLSTSPLSFQTKHGYTHFEFNPRSLFETMLVAGESTWITYITYDFLLVLTRKSNSYVAPLASYVAWITVVGIDIASPYRITANLNRKCSIDFVSKKIACTSGDIEVGSSSRATLIVLIQVLSVVVAVFVVQVFNRIRKTQVRFATGHLLLSGTALGFLHSQSKNEDWILDRASCVMCGLITFQRSIFDLKLWLLVPDSATQTSKIKWGMKMFHRAKLDLKTDEKKLKDCGPPIVSVDSSITLTRRLITLSGLIYVFSTIFGSITYLSLTSSNMANDFWWANYNASREHVFVTRLFNTQLSMRPHVGSIAISDNKFMDDANYTISLSPGVPRIIKPLYLSHLLLTDGSDLGTIIHGLRAMDACLAPWISSQYCWLDFEKKWEMANSAARQTRCEKTYSSNAAVYLESMLRNIKWPQLRSCWGSSLELAFASPLSKTPDGLVWWTNVQSVRTSEADEVNYWKSFGVTEYRTDWQNYKTLGIIETFDIQNAFGIAYPMTLKYTNGTFNLASQTSMKMYWGFASDLWAITSSSTSMYKSSLIRQDDKFAFSNRTMELILVENGTLGNADLENSALSVFRQTIGPFGSVDLKRVEVPRSLLTFATNFFDILSHLCVQSADFARIYLSPYSLMRIVYMPPPWSWSNSTSPRTVGGNLLCRELPSTSVGGSMFVMTGAFTGCANSISEEMRIPSSFRHAAAIGSNFVKTNDTDGICSTITEFSMSSCEDQLLLPSMRLLLNDSLFDPELLIKLQTMAAIAQRDIQAMPIEINQYGKTVNDTIAIMRHQIFDPAYPTFHYVAWLLAMEWATNSREVISIQGDLGMANIMTTHYDDITTLVNPLEIPVNVAYYIRYVCLYVTGIIMCVAALASIYLFINKGYVEGWNLFEINRVVGIVWIGRTFLFIRSMAAICLLSTQVLLLENTNNVWHLVDSTQLLNESSGDRALRIFKTFLAAGEVSWLGYVLNDILVVFTAQYTTAYVIKCTTIVWGAAALLSMLSPPNHKATVQRECKFAHVDFQLVCTSGTIAIGSFGRLMSLVAICIGSIFVCYIYERIRRPTLPPSHQTSFFLSASAKYMFQRDYWMHDEDYCIDPSSAAINGILSVRFSNTIFLFDLKIWRLFVLEVPKEKREIIEQTGKRHLLTAIPLPS